MTNRAPQILRLPSSASRTDGALCRAFLAGDREAFGELVRRHQETVFCVVRRYAKSVDEARDLTQRVFLQAFEAAKRTLPRMEAGGDDAPLRAWLLRIAINLGKNQVRDASRWPRAPLELVEGRLSEPAMALESLERAERESLVRASVGSLPPRQREVFSLRVDAGLPFSEIAETLGISEGNAKSHFHHAVKRLRDQVRARLTGGHDAL